MRRNKFFNGIVFSVLVTAVGGILSAVQEPPPPPDGPNKHMAMRIAVGDMEFNDKLVKGAPFSAQATTVTDQTLADGNHIHHQNNASLYRDNQGRTRRETTLEGLGPWSATEAEAKPVVMINDPVTGVHYMLRPDEHKAIQMPLPKLARTLPSKAGGKAAEDKVFFAAPVLPPPPDAPGGDFHIFYQRFDREEQSGQSESLGTQAIEGVKAEGTRITETIPAGSIGNDQPILIVTERWYSPDLQMVIMSKRSDPRVGETTFRITNISRAEPAAILFQVPADYTFEQAPTPHIVVQQSTTESKP
jgi:hypothetical protein